MRKKIDVQVDCPEGLMVSHDRKWTTEALFNILDNAVKYNSEGWKHLGIGGMLGNVCKD